jgi:predicted lipoprotein with Yx(FWY)xxD motif
LGRTEEHGQFIADVGGRALYLLEADTQGSSSCYDACAQMWPPFASPVGTPRAGAAGVEPNLIGTIQRRDGTTQVTFGGHPLYYYTKDQGPGQATGQDVTDQWGEWYLVTPKGGKLEHGGHS